MGGTVGIDALDLVDTAPIGLLIRQQAQHFRLAARCQPLLLRALLFRHALPLAFGQVGVFPLGWLGTAGVKLPRACGPATFRQEEIAYSPAARSAAPSR